MGKARLRKRLSTALQPATKSIDLKARKRIEELYELTDEIISAYNEINEKYVHHIYDKYQRLKQKNRKLQEQIDKHHCKGCHCQKGPNEDFSTGDSSIEDEPRRTSHFSTTTPNSTSMRSRKILPFVIQDIEQTPSSNGNDHRIAHEFSDDESRKSVTPRKSNRTNSKKISKESDDEENNEIDEATDSNELPRSLRLIIERKATKNDNAKGYLLEIPNYPSLCNFLRQKSRTSFDQRPSEELLRPFIINQLGPSAAKDSKVRMRIRDEFREIHRSYLRTFMHDPHGFHKTTRNKTNLGQSFKKSP